MLRIRLDVLFLKEGKSIPPHAHRGVLSGFLMLEGSSDIRHYHVSCYNDKSVDVTLTVDKTLKPGDHTVNSDQKDNIHWLQGVKNESVLYRFNITGLPSVMPEYKDLAGRMYVDPRNAGKNSVTEISFITEADAKNIVF
jgi:hypothetical protein